MIRVLKWSRYRLDLDQGTRVMGILNVTPDSFSDGGRYLEPERAVEHGLEMARQGAHILDVGGESTRPYAEKVSEQEEMDRVVPVIRILSGELSIPVSIDSYKSSVVAEALAAGASMVNDISALRFDSAMGRVVAGAGVPLVLMHMRGTPGNMQDSPFYRDIAGQICDFLAEAVRRAVEAGVAEDLLIVDPGIGFGKTFDHNLQLIRDLERFLTLDKPLLLGTSNKAFIGHILDKGPDERDTGTMATVAAGVMNGAHMVRVHNVQAAVETVKIIDAVRWGRTTA